MTAPLCLLDLPLPPSFSASSLCSSHQMHPAHLCKSTLLATPPTYTESHSFSSFDLVLMSPSPMPIHRFLIRVPPSASSAIEGLLTSPYLSLAGHSCQKEIALVQWTRDWPSIGSSLLSKVGDVRQDDNTTLRSLVSDVPARRPFIDLITYLRG